MSAARHTRRSPARPACRSGRSRVASAWGWTSCATRWGPLRCVALTVETRFRVELSAPLDIAGSLELFKRSGDDLIDRWDGVRLVRALVTDRRCVPFVARANTHVNAPSF